MIATMQSASQYKSHLQDVVETGGYAEQEAAVNLPVDADIQDKLDELKSRIGAASLKTVVVIGMGGSALGTQAVYEALLPTGGAQLLVLNSLSQIALDRLVNHLTSFESKESFCVCMISKSGGTTETLANTDALVGKLSDHFGDVNDRLVVISDYESPLYEQAGERNIARLSIPEQVGGRFSVLSAVGLVPLSLSGVDVSDLLDGAGSVRELLTNNELTSDPMLAAAAIQKIHLDSGRRLHNTFVFSDRLESFGMWEQQLYAESLGKRKDKQGRSVFQGIVPLVSVGPRDLHSLLQLYMGGPRIIYTEFVSLVDGSSASDSDSASWIANELLEDAAGKSVSEIKRAIYAGVTGAYQEEGLPFSEFKLDSLNAYSLGQLLQFKMVVVMYLGVMFDINTFNQPGVERYKELTKQALTNSS